MIDSTIHYLYVKDLFGLSFLVFRPHMDINMSRCLRSTHQSSLIFLLWTKTSEEIESSYVIFFKLTYSNMISFTFTELGNI